MIIKMTKSEVFIDNRQGVEIDKDLEAGILLAITTVLEYEDMDLDYEVSLSFVDNEEIRELNKNFRNIDRETDVLSFPNIEDFELDYDFGPKLLGDIVISLEKAKEQAKEYKHSFEREIIYLTVHSMLHLLGYDHMEEEEKLIMRGKEKEIMNILKVFK